MLNVGLGQHPTWRSIQQLLLLSVGSELVSGDLYIWTHTERRTENSSKFSTNNDFKF